MIYLQLAHLYFKIILSSYITKAYITKPITAITASIIKAINIFNNFKTISYICIQVKENSLERFTANDAIIK